MSSFRQRLLNLPYTIWSCVFVAVPLLMVVYYTFTDKNGGFTLENLKIFSDTAYISVFLYSVWYAFIATVICLLIAYPLSYIISKQKQAVQDTLMVLVMLPMWMNLLIVTYSWREILSNNGIINSLLEKLGFEKIAMIGTPFAVVLGMVYCFLPFMILPILSSMQKLQNDLIEAGEDLGATKLSILKRIIFPLTLPGVISGITMVFVPSISTFYISQKLGNGMIILIGDLIDRQFSVSGNYNVGAAISLVMMILILLSVAIMNKFADDEGGTLKWK